jgi:hypothetical protein
MVLCLLGVWNWHLFVGHFISVLCLDPCTPILRYVILSSVKQRFYIIVNNMHSLLLSLKKRLVRELFLSDLVGILVLCGFAVCVRFEFLKGVVIALQNSQYHPWFAQVVLFMVHRMHL